MRFFAFLAGLLALVALAGCSVTTYSSDGQNRKFQSWRFVTQTGINSVSFRQGVNPDGTPIIDAELSGYTSDQSRALDVANKAIDVAARILPGGAAAPVPAPAPAAPAPAAPTVQPQSVPTPAPGPDAPRVTWAGPATHDAGTIIGGGG